MEIDRWSPTVRLSRGVRGARAVGRDERKDMVGGVGVESGEPLMRCTTAAEAQAWGTLAPRYWTGKLPASSSRPAKSSGSRRESKRSAASNSAV